MGILLTILRTLGGVGLSMIMSLLTEKTMKRLAILGLEKIAEKYGSETAKKALEIAKESWESNPTQPKT